MTDCSPKIVSWWEKNTYLQPYFKDGLLEVSLFDMTSDEKVWKSIRTSSSDPFSRNAALSADHSSKRRSQLPPTRCGSFILIGRIAIADESLFLATRVFILRSQVVTASLVHLSPFFHSSCKWSFQPAIAESSLEGFSDVVPLVRQLRHSHPVILCFSSHTDVHYDTSPVGVAVFAPLRQARRRPRIRPGGR